MKNDSNIIDDAIADASDNPASEADAPEVKLTKAEKAAIKAIETKAKKAQAKKDKAAADKVKAAEKAAKALVIADAKAVKTVETGLKPLITAGLKAMHMVGTGNEDWVTAAFKMRELCKDTKAVNFMDVAAEAFGVAKNTASKLANAGEMMVELRAAAADPSIGGPEKGKWLEHLPMGNINNLSTISRWGDTKMDLAIDTEVLRVDSTEREINDFNRDFDDNGKAIVVKTVPSTDAADAEDLGEIGVGTGSMVSESETPTQLMSRLADAATDLRPAQLIKLICTLSGNLSGKRIEDMFKALEAQHPATEEGGE